MVQLIQVVNEVLSKIGDVPVNSVTSNSLAMLAATNVKRAYDALCNDAPWPWLERVITVDEWTNELAVMPAEVSDIKYVTFKGRKLQYIESEHFHARPNQVYEGSVPHFWSLFGRNVLVRPYPNETDRPNVLFYVYYQESVDDKDSSYEIEIPKNAEYLLVLRACISMAIDHRQNDNVAQSYTAEYQRLLSQIAHKMSIHHRSSSLLL